MHTARTGSGRPLIAAALVVAAYGAGVFAIGVTSEHEVTAAWWPAAGIGAAAVLLVARRQWPVLLAALFVAYAAANLTGGRPLDASLCLALSNLAETVIVGALTVQVVGRRIRTLQSVWAFFAIAAVGALVAASGIAATAWLLLGGSFWSTLETTLASHAASVMIVAPLALIDWRRRLPRRRLELAAQSIALLLATDITFGPDSRLTVAFAPLPLLMWAAVRFDVRVVVVEQVVVAGVISVFTRLGWGPFTFYTDTPGDPNSSQLAQLYLLCVVVIGLPLAVAMRQRDRAVARVTASERVFRRNFTQARLPVALVQIADGAVTFSDCNAATGRVLDRRPDLLVGRPVEEFLRAPEMMDVIRAAPEGGITAWSGSIGVLGASRTRLDGILSLLDIVEDRTYFSLHMIDVTEPLELQERLQAERDYTRAVIDTASSMIVLTTVDGIVIAANPATTTLTGFTEDELVGQPLWRHLVPAPRREEVGARFGDPDRLSRAGETVITTRSGDRLTVVFSNAVHQVSPDAPITYVLTGTDVTEARENEGMVNHLLRSATTIAFVGTDLTGQITLFNTGAERMLGLSVEQATGRRFVEFLSEDSLPPADGAGGATTETAQARFQRVVDQAAEVGAPETRDATWLPEGRAPIKVSMTTNPVTDSDGTTFGYLFVARDITDNRRSQEILVQALRREREVVARLKDLDGAKDEFVSTVSHELRTPMSSIIGSAEMLSEGIFGELDPQQQRMVEVISRNGDRLLALADDLLMLASFDRSSWPEQGGQVDLRGVVEESGSSVATMLASRELDVDYGMPAEPVLVNGDPSHLERAVTNLLTNAVKFTPDGGRIEVRVESDPESRSASVVVADTGLGIPESDLDAVFTRFFRTDLVQQRAIQGSGLGLSIVKTIVESHDGRVDVRSRSGGGTTFTITLPLLRTRSRAR